MKCLCETILNAFAGNAESKYTSCRFTKYLVENRLVFPWASTSNHGLVGLMCPNLPRMAYLGVATSRSLLDELRIVELPAHADE